MLVTVEGMVTDVRLLQLLKVIGSMAVKPSGRVMEVMAEQLWKAPPPMLVTVEGMVINCRLLQLLKALGPMAVKPSGRVTEVMAEQK